MDHAGIDPWQLQWRYELRNRLERWRAARAQTAFNATALALLLALLALLGLRALLSSADVLSAALAARAGWIAPVLGLVLAWRQASAAARHRQCLQRSWLAAQPVPAPVVRRRVRRAAWRDALLQLAVLALLLAPLHVPATVWLAAGAAVLVGFALGVPLSRALSGAQRGRGWWGARHRDTGRGRFWRWQWIESGAALRGRRIALAFWAWLLVPIGSGPQPVLALAVCGVLVAMLATAWQRSLAVLPQAQAWLDPQPLPAGTLLRATVVLPALFLLVAAGLLAASLLALGTAALALVAAVTVLGVGSLQYACVAATRRTPARAPLLLVLHLVLLGSVLQAALPLALPVWLAQLAWLLRRALRA